MSVDIDPNLPAVEEKRENYPFRVVARNLLKEGADQALDTHSLP